MTQVVADPPEGTDVAKKKNRQGPGSGGRQVAFRAPDDLYAQLDRVSKGLGLDISNLIRMILRKHIQAYVKEVEDLENKPPADADA
jgi:hypothetical protein